MPIRISHEELALVSRLIGSPALRALPLDLGADPTSQAAKLDAAESSLAARGWLRREGMTVSLETTVMNAVAFLAVAPVVLGVRRASHQGISADVFYLSNTLKVHVRVGHRTYEIDACAPDALQTVLQAAITGEHVSDPFRQPIHNLSIKGFASLSALAHLNDLSDAKILGALDEQGTYFDSASDVLALYRKHWAATVNLSAWVSTEHNSPSSYLTLLDTTQGWWQIAYPTPELVDLIPLTDAQVAGLSQNLYDEMMGLVR